MSNDLLAGAEPFAASNGPGGVLVLHGFTGSPYSMRSLAEALADAGLSVELPLLPGHGTSIEDLEAATFADWLAVAEESYLALAARSDKVAVVGLSMGGTLACALAQRHGELAGLVLINPLAKAPVPELSAMLESALAGGARVIPSIGSDVAKANVSGGGYDATPIAPMLSLFEGTAQVGARLSEIGCPVLLFSSRTDHVVPTDSGDLVAEQVAGPIERVMLENSYHVATLDNDAPELEARSVAFIQKLMGS